MTTSPTTENTSEEPNNEQTQNLDTNPSTSTENLSDGHSEPLDGTIPEGTDLSSEKIDNQKQWIDNDRKDQDINIPPKPDYPPTAHEKPQAVSFEDKTQEKVTVTPPMYSPQHATSSSEHSFYQEQDYQRNNDQYPPTQMSYGRQTNVMALTSMIVSLGSILFGGLFAIAGVILGHIALKQIERTGEEGKGFALTGLIAGYIQIALWVLGGILFLFIAMIAMASAP